MKDNHFGFRVRKVVGENDVDASEKTEGIILLKEDVDPFRVHIGLPVRYPSDDGPVFGIYRESDEDGQLYFQPSVTPLPNIRDGGFIQELNWETERPTIIPYNRNSAMRPVSLDSLRKIVGIDIITDSAFED